MVTEVNWSQRSTDPFAHLLALARVWW